MMHAADPSENRKEPAVTSPSNVEIYRSLVAAFNLGGPDAVLGFFSEDVEVYDPDLPGDGTYRGREGLRHMFDQLLGGTEQTLVRRYDVIPAGDRVVALTHTYARGPGGNPEVEMRDAHTMTFRDGKIVYWRLYLDRDEALSDAGLDPDEVAGPSRS